MRYDEQKGAWMRAGTVVGEAALSPQPVYRAADNAPKPGSRHDPRRVASPQRVVSPRAARPHSLEHLVNDMAFSRDRWFAATENGLLSSADRGATWSIFPVGPMTTLPVSSVRVSPDGQSLWVVSVRGLVFSRNAGKTWSWHDLPLEAGGALRLDVVPGSANGQTLAAAARNGLYISRDAGDRWLQAAYGLPAAPIQDLAIVGSVFLASMQTGGLYISYDSGRTWTRIEGTLAEGYFPVVTTRGAHATIFAASATEGLYAVELASPATSTSSNAQGHGP